MSLIKDQQYYLIYQKIIDAKRNNLYLPVQIVKGLNQFEKFISLYEPKHRKMFGYLPTYKKQFNEPQQLPLTKKILLSKFAQKLIFGKKN